MNPSYENSNLLRNNRIIIVDALRGFALFCIVLIHFTGHFDFSVEPGNPAIFTKETDQIVKDTVYFIILGKAYSIFAMMFGLSFFIQLNRQEEKGVDFRFRYAWRLLILVFMGFFHSLIYNGDILLIYALYGFLLVFLYKVKTKWLILITILLALQLPHIYFLVESLINPTIGEYSNNNVIATNWLESIEVYKSGNLSDVIKFNLWKGRTVVWGWTFFSGRYFQLMALFILGLIIGRKRYFENIGKYRKSLIRIFIISLVVTTLLYIFAMPLKSLQLSVAQHTVLEFIITSYINLAYTTSLACAFILLYIRFEKGIIFHFLSGFGKMSLTNYITQSLIGVTLFFGFGLGLYRYLGATLSLLLGLLIVIAQIIFCRIWLKHFYYGPFEWIWRALTFFNFKIKFRKKISKE